VAVGASQLLIGGDTTRRGHRESGTEATARADSSTRERKLDY
jgi:hypothetical protein